MRSRALIDINSIDYILLFTGTLFKYPNYGLYSTLYSLRGHLGYFQTMLFIRVCHINVRDKGLNL